MARKPSTYQLNRLKYTKELCLSIKEQTKTSSKDEIFATLERGKLILLAGHAADAGFQSTAFAASRELIKRPRQSYTAADQINLYKDDEDFDTIVEILCPACDTDRTLFRKEFDPLNHAAYCPHCRTAGIHIRANPYKNHPPREEVIEIIQQRLSQLKSDIASGAVHRTK